MHRKSLSLTSDDSADLGFFKVTFFSANHNSASLRRLQSGHDDRVQYYWSAAKRANKPGQKLPNLPYDRHFQFEALDTDILSVVHFPPLPILAGCPRRRPTCYRSQKQGLRPLPGHSLSYQLQILVPAPVPVLETVLRHFLPILDRVSHNLHANQWAMSFGRSEFRFHSRQSVVSCGEICYLFRPSFRHLLLLSVHLLWL